MQNVRVNIWHCTKDGLYSGYDNNMNPGQAGLTYLRGYQFTDANGEVNFTTIFPGWYSGRLCHIHFQVYVSSTYSAVSQMMFDPDMKNALYADNSTIYTKGSDPMTWQSDNVFSDGITYQEATLTKISTSEYSAYFEATVNGTGVLGVGHIEAETAKQMELGQNFPNPFAGVTTIPFKLHNAGDIKLDVYSIQGQLVHSETRHQLAAGNHEIELDFAKLSLPVQSYAYQLQVTNAAGVFRSVKMMSAAAISR